ncbi:hypothetical protein BLNAU_13741 [Blattamonas nauphoetae]|uniref:Uncharacterized protein n=1 Tax=Blattamonas nauphoetae TaxID=2049346 RepID=A0ABQ9XJ06_9EUKA|nr:hypothetical protein BLNAU_13741 [Blattamonas nauphoetae]
MIRVLSIIIAAVMMTGMGVEMSTTMDCTKSLEDSSMVRPRLVRKASAEELSYQSLLTNLSSHSIEISPMKWPTGPFDPNDCHEQPTFNSTLSSEWSYAFRNTQQSAL